MLFIVLSMSEFSEEAREWVEIWTGSVSDTGSLRVFGGEVPLCGSSRSRCLDTLGTKCSSPIITLF